MIFVMILVLIFTPLVTPNTMLAADETSIDQEETGFRFTDLGWSEDEDDFFEYKPNEGVFKRGTKVYGFMEVAGFANSFRDDKYHIDLTVDVYLKTTFGLRLFGQKDVINFDNSSKKPIDEIWFYLWVDIPWWAPRTSYIAEVVVRDQISNEDLSHEEKITVE